METGLEQITSLSRSLRTATPLSESDLHPVHIEGPEEYFIGIDFLQQSILKKLVDQNGVQKLVHLPSQTGLPSQTEREKQCVFVDKLGLDILQRLVDNYKREIRETNSNIKAEVLPPYRQNSMGASFAEKFKANLRKHNFNTDRTQGPVTDVSLDEKEEALLGTVAKLSPSFFPKSK